MSTEDRKEITRLINEWNSSRYELFALSEPNERLEFHGVMRFYFEDTGEKVSTKCIRVESTATTDDVIKVLIEKFRPDMKSLSVPKDYSIYEVHADSQERKLDPNERPLWIQLEWGKEGREGRFLLKNENVKTFHVQVPSVANEKCMLRDKKRLSKREKKKLQQQQENLIQWGTQTQKIKEKEQKGKVAEHLYKEVPDSNFTRSISNPEIVMARRRQQKLENKLIQIKNCDGGGTLKVYGETLKPDIPYKTLLLSNQDTAAFVVKETLDKYGMSSEDPDNYCLVQVVTPSREDRDKHGAQIKEYILEDHALPLAILMKYATNSGSILFQIRRCPPDILAIRKKKKLESEQQQGIYNQKQHQIVFQPTNVQNQNEIRQHQQLLQIANYELLFDSGKGANQQLYSQSMSSVQQKNVNNQVNMPVKTTPPTLALNTVSSGGDSGLPGLLEFSDDSEDLLLQHICSQHIFTPQFRLAPVYTMYMMLRFRLSQKYKPEYSIGDKLHSLDMLIHKMVNYVREAVDQAHADKQLLPYWLANSSELLYFLKQDVHLRQQSIDAQETLAECVQTAFKYLVNLMQLQLERVLGAFFDPSELVDDTDYDTNPNDLQSDMMANGRPSLKSVLQVLNEAMHLMRSSRVNAALTIQLFSQLFHYISMSLFNRLVRDQRCLGLCSRYWGVKLSRRLSKIHTWAEKQGLELAADCHLQRIVQTVYLLQAPKHDLQQLSAISSNCFTLNSAQVKCLLRKYVLSNHEPPLCAQLCSNLIAIAQNTADDVLKQDGRMVQVEEEIDLQLPFMLPEDGHSSEMIKGLHAGLLDFLETLQNTGHCWLLQNTQGAGNWRKFFNKEQEQGVQFGSEPATTKPQHTAPLAHTQSPQSIPLYVNNQLQQVVHNEPKVVKIILGKKKNSLGLSIVSAQGSNNVTGIYIKSVVPGGAASDDGRLSAGDQLLAVDDLSLVNVTQERAAELLCKSGLRVVLTVARDAAYYHNLDAMLLSKSHLPPLSSTQLSIASKSNQLVVEEPQQAKPHGQLYDQIWSNSNNNVQQHLPITTRQMAAATVMNKPAKLLLNRSNQEVNMVSKLRTEMEFDKRVLEMSVGQGSCNDENNEDASHHELVNEEDARREDIRFKKRLELVHVSSPSAHSRQPLTPSQLQHHQQADIQSFHGSMKLQQQQQQQQVASSSSSSDQFDSRPSTPQTNRVMFYDTSQLFEIDQDHFSDDKTIDTPSVIGANEIYVDRHLKNKQQQQQQQQMAQLVIEGEKLSFKEKMRLFAKHASESENRLKSSQKS